MRATVHNLFETATAATSNDSNDPREAERMALQNTLTKAVDEAESVVTLLVGGQDPRSEACAALIVSGAEAITAVAQRVHTLEALIEQQGKQMELLQLQLKELQHQLKELQRQVKELQPDSDSLLLRELAIQTVSKIARKAIGCSMWDAREATLQLIKCSVSGPGAQVYRDIMAQYPLLKAAVMKACDGNQGATLDQCNHNVTGGGASVCDGGAAELKGRSPLLLPACRARARPWHHATHVLARGDTDGKP